MRKHDVRKWLHAILDLLPVIIIPVFMIYSHRHTIDNYAVEVPQNLVVDFNQQLKNFDDSSWHANESSFEYVNNKIRVYPQVNANEPGIYCSLNVKENHKYLISIYSENLGSFDLRFGSFDTTFADNISTYGELNQKIIESSISGNIILFYLYQQSTIQVYSKPMCIDLTQMYGSGNEPTLDEFNSYYPNEYYEYTTSKIELVKNVGTITYNDTDIGSQMLYCLYNSVDKYFNFNNVFGFNNVYDWLSLNIFNGNPPIAIYIVWNIALYEFLMDLIMLLYALFMWFIDMCEHLIDRSFGVASGRKK